VLKGTPCACFLISNNDENAISQRYAEAKGIMMPKAALAIDRYSCFRLIQKSASSLSLNSVSRTEIDLISVLLELASKYGHILNKQQIVFLSNHTLCSHLSLENICRKDFVISNCDQM
jgi:hypothetical protein